MMEDSLLAINNSKICSSELIKEIRNHLQLLLQVKQKNRNDSIQGSNNNVCSDIIVNDSASSNDEVGSGDNGHSSTLTVSPMAYNPSNSTLYSSLDQYQYPKHQHQQKKKYRIMDPITSIPIDKFAQLVNVHSKIYQNLH
jgi:hypothetical protein